MPAQEYTRGGLLVQEISLVKYGPDGVIAEADLSDYFASISFYESLFNIYVNGSVTIYDGGNLATNLPITGTERLRVRLAQPGYEDIPIIDREFAVIGVYDRQLSNPFAETYTIDFASDYYYTAIGTYVSQAFTDANVGQTIYKLFDEGVWRSEPETTYGQYNFVIPNLNLEMTAKLLQRYALNEGGINDFLFYATTNGLQFRSLTNIFKKTPIAVLSTLTENLVDDETKIEIEESAPKGEVNVERFIAQGEKYTLLDPAQIVLDGALGSRLYTFNPLLQTYTSISHDIEEDSEKYPAVENAENRWYGAFQPIHNGYARTYCGISSLDNNKVAGNKSDRPGFGIEKSMMSRNIVGGLMSNGWKTQIITTENFDIHPGDVINYNRRKPNQQGDPRFENIMGGKYLVLSVAHGMDRVTGLASSIIEITKDSYAKGFL